MMLFDRRGISGAIADVIEIVSSVINVEFKVDCDAKKDDELAIGMFTFAKTENSDAGK